MPMTKDEIQKLATDAYDAALHAALNAACRHIQDSLGVTDGGLAGVYFSGSKSLQWSDLVEYIEGELAQKTEA